MSADRTLPQILPIVIVVFVRNPELKNDSRVQGFRGFRGLGVQEFRSSEFIEVDSNFYKSYLGNLQNGLSKLEAQRIKTRTEMLNVE